MTTTDILIPIAILALPAWVILWYKLKDIFASILIVAVFSSIAFIVMMLGTSLINELYKHHS